MMLVFPVTLPLAVPTDVFIHKNLAPREKRTLFPGPVISLGQPEVCFHFYLFYFSSFLENVKPHVRDPLNWPFPILIYFPAEFSYFRSESIYKKRE